MRMLRRACVGALLRAHAMLCSRAAHTWSQAASVAGNEGKGDEAAPGGAMANAGRTDATTGEDNNPRSMVWPLDPITLQRSGCSDGFENLDLTCPVSPAS